DWFAFPMRSRTLKSIGHLLVSVAFDSAWIVIVSSILTV
nr:hypothetical protein [Tanacetum cinerariifolium]